VGAGAGAGGSDNRGMVGWEWAESLLQVGLGGIISGLSVVEWGTGVGGRSVELGAGKTSDKEQSRDG